MYLYIYIHINECFLLWRFCWGQTHLHTSAVFLSLRQPFVAESMTKSPADPNTILATGTWTWADGFVGFASISSDRIHHLNQESGNEYGFPFWNITRDIPSSFSFGWPFWSCFHPNLPLIFLLWCIHSFAQPINWIHSTHTCSNYTSHIILFHWPSSSLTLLAESLVGYPLFFL